jgi:GNAT superfamily N-acetyltransferase
MNSLPFTPGIGARAVTISRVADNQWHAVENDLVVGRGHASRRLDGRTFLSGDTWRATIFDLLARAMVADRPEPLYTVVDETDQDLATNWQRAGFAVLAGEQRRGIARALLSHVLDGLHQSGVETASAEVNEANVAAMALFEGLGARRTGSNLELVRRQEEAVR